MHLSLLAGLRPLTFGTQPPSKIGHITYKALIILTMMMLELPQTVFISGYAVNGAVAKIQHPVVGVADAFLIGGADGLVELRLTLG